MHMRMHNNYWMGKIESIELQCNSVYVTDMFDLEQTNKF